MIAPQWGSHSCGLAVNLVETATLVLDHPLFPNEQELRAPRLMAGYHWSRDTGRYGFGFRIDTRNLDCELSGSIRSDTRNPFIRGAGEERSELASHCVVCAISGHPGKFTQVAELNRHFRGEWRILGGGAEQALSGSARNANVPPPKG